MKKVHGPAFRKQLIDLTQCPACHGKAVISGLFHQIDCDRCNASGWVVSGTGEALPLQDLVTQLSFKLQQADQQLLGHRRALSGPAQQYERNNRRGAGGSNYTGD